MTAGRHLPAFPQNHGGYKDHERGSQGHQQALQDSASTQQKPYTEATLSPVTQSQLRTHDFDEAARTSSHHSLTSEAGDSTSQAELLLGCQGLH